MNEIKKEPQEGAAWDRDMTINSVKTVNVIRVISIVGDGRLEDPVRRIVSFYTIDGRFIGSYASKSIDDER